MSEPRIPTTPPERWLRALHAYHDGELSALGRWRFERRLRRSPELRRELAGLEEIGAGLREHVAGAPSPDLWDGLALRLPAADARRREAAAPKRRGLGWLAWPVAATAVGVAFALGWPESEEVGGAVRWLDSGGHDVMVLEEAPDTTIIWVFDAPSEGAGRGGMREAV